MEFANANLDLNNNTSIMESMSLWFVSVILNGQISDNIALSAWCPNMCRPKLDHRMFAEKIALITLLRIYLEFVFAITTSPLQQSTTESTWNCNAFVPLD